MNSQQRHNARHARCRYLSAAALAATLASAVPASAQSLFVSSRGTNESVFRFDGNTGAFVDEIVPRNVGGLNQPDGITIGPDGALYAAASQMGGDNFATAVLRFDADTGAFLGEFVARRYGAISDIVFGPSGNLFVSNFTTHEIQEFDGATGAFIRAFATQPATHCCPQALVFGPTGNLFVAYEQGVEEFDGTTGALVKAFAAGQFAYGLAFAPDGTLLVSMADAAPSHNIQKYDPLTGSMIGVFVPGGTLAFPQTIKFGPDGRLYVADRSNRRVLRFDWPTGNLLDVFVAPLSGGMNDPINLAFGPAPRPTITTRGGWRRPAFAASRYTAFESALPLLPDDTNGVTDIYVHDDVNDTLHRLSVSTRGREAIGGESVRPTINASGRFVAFESLASNLVYGDTNGLPDVFLHDRDADENGVFDEAGGISTTRISVSSAGDQALGGASTWASISGNGRFVAFQSGAANLDAGDTNGAVDVFIHDRLLGRTRRVSVPTDGATATAGTSLRPAISQNGRYVAFDSAAVLTAGDTNGARDVFVHDRDLDADGIMDEIGAVATRRVSIDSSGAEAAGGDSVDASITDDGRYVVFASSARLVPSDTNAVSDVFIHDRDTDADGVFDEPGGVATRRLSVGIGGAQLAVASGVPRISANGKLLVFLTASSPSAAVTAARDSVAAAVVGSDPGKSTPGRVPDPTLPAPPPPIFDQPLPTGPDGDMEDPSTSPDGDVWGGTDTHGAPTVVIVEEPEDTKPYISSVFPAQGAAGGGTLVTIEGRDLAGTLYWNGAPLAPLTQSATRWTVVTPPRGGGPVSVTLSLGTAAVRSNEQTFTYVASSVPRWTSHAPASGPVAGNFSLTITGTGFVATPTVRLGPSSATVTAWTSTSITVTVPAFYVAGPVPVVITNGDGAETTSDVPFTFENGAGPVSIFRVDPGVASTAGGTAVTIFGDGFAEGTTVMFGGHPGGAVQLLSSRALVVQAPAAVPGPTTLTVAVPGHARVDAPLLYVGPPAFQSGCSGTDADGDGIDDAWATQYGLAPGDATDDPDHDGLTSLQECQADTHPRGLYTRYLAEGATGSFFDTKIALANPNLTSARVLLRFQSDTGASYGRFLLLPPMSRRTVRPASIDGLGAVGGVSTVVESDVEIVVDRTMEWGLGPSTGVYGSHAETGLAAPRTTWYLAEGATHGDFDLFYLLQNPGTTAAVVRVRFLRPGGQPPIERDYTVPAQRRFTLLVDRIPGLEATDVSAVFHSLNDVPIIVERAMYRTGAGMRAFEAGHDSAAVEAPSTHWFLAEGATAPLFDTFVLLANPNDAAAAVSITYLLSGGQTVARSYQVAGNSRYTLHVSDEAPELVSTSLSMIVAVTNGVPIIVERSMWWPSQIGVATLPAFGAFWGEAHNSPGATETGTKWAVADGETGAPPKLTATYYLIANTSAFAADVTVTLLSETDGSPLTRHFAVAANSRFTVDVATNFPETRQDGNRTYGAVIESLSVGAQSPAQIVVERAMYSNSSNVVWAAGSNLLGTRLR